MNSIDIIITQKNLAMCVSLISFSTERLSDVVEDLEGQLGAERDEFVALALVTLEDDDVHLGQCLDIGERHAF